MKLKKFNLIFITLALFSLSVYLAFMQGSVDAGLTGASATHMSAPSEMSPLVYTGIRAEIANVSANVINGLTAVFGNNILLSIVILALLVELILLYSSVRIQLKQKKIHLFHKKLVDRFSRGEIQLSETKHELKLIYAVNEKLHARGAIFVVIQVAVFFMVLWGLNLLVNVPYLVSGSWSILNFSLLSKPTGTLIPLVVALLYFVHSLTKIYYKEREDYISSTQSLTAIVFAVLGSALVYWFSNVFAIALTLYIATLISFSTIRYIIVEQHAKSWGKLAQKNLMEMLRTIEPHKDKFQYISRKWSHIPVVRYLNFHLLEESLSMSLGLLLALSFFGAIPL